MKKDKKPAARIKTKQQLVKEGLVILFSAIFVGAIGITAVVLFGKGIVAMENGRDVFMLVIGILLAILALIGLPVGFYFCNWQYFNKSKFERKCNDLVSFEEKTLNEAGERISHFKSNLQSLGLELHVSVIWYDFVAAYYEEKCSFKDRIDFCTGYSCMLQCAVTGECEDPMNEEQINFDRVFPISEITGVVMRFRKTAVTEDYFKDFEDCCKKISEMGYENFLDKYAKPRNV